MQLMLIFFKELSSNVWIDHVDVSSDKDHDKDYYDGLIDASYSPPPLPLTQHANTLSSLMLRISSPSVTPISTTITKPP